MERRSVSAAILFCFLILIVFAGCRRKNGEPRDVSSPDAAEEPVQKLSLERQDKAGEEERISSEEELTGEAEPEHLPSFSGPLQLQQILPQSRILPDGDFCGPFVDFLTADKDEHGAGLLVRNFFHSYQSGTIDERLLYYKRNPLFQEELNAFLSYGKDIRDFAAGSFSLSGARASIRVRLYSETGSIAGILYLVKTDRNWFLEDWELPISQWPGDSLPEGEG